MREQVWPVVPVCERVSDEFQVERRVADEALEPVE